MSFVKDVQADPKAALFDALEDQKVGMLGVPRSGQHMQPMSHFVDRKAGELWFITSRDTDLVRAVGLGAQAHHCVMTSDQTFYSCLGGVLEQVDDPQKLDELWSTVAAAWFEDGREDSDIVLLRLKLRDAAIWTATDSAIIFGLEIARSNLKDEHKPDIGDHMVVQFHAA